VKRKVIFSKIAEQKLESLLKYLEVEWSQSSKKKFLKKLTKSLEQIDTFPESNRRSKSLKLYRCKVTKQTSFYYTFNQKEIHVSYLLIIEWKTDWMNNLFRLSFENHN